MKGKSLRRALETNDALRVNANIPLIVDTTELITPETAKTMLQRNKKNRPINWRKVDEYAAVMSAGQWRLHGQGIMLDAEENILTGQKRLWAVIRSGVNVYMRISRGNPKESVSLIDRGIPQSARDLAARQTGRMHSPVEASIARGLLVLRGNLKPSADDLADTIENHSVALSIVISGTRGGKKTREILMILSAIISRFDINVQPYLTHVPILADKLQALLSPRTAQECWGKGVAFSLAMEQAKKLVNTL